MEASATLKYARMAPRKVRVVLDSIRGMNVELALAQLSVTNRKAAGVVYKLVASAAANASVDQEIHPSRLEVVEAYADEGPTLRRFQPRAMGRATRIRKRTSHVTVIVAERE